MELNVTDIRTSAANCAPYFNISMSTVIQCAQGREGNNLEHKMAVQTSVLNPPHKFVPWITLNGNHTDEIQNQAETDLIGLICNTYTGSKRPPACTKYSNHRRGFRIF